MSVEVICLQRSLTGILREHRGLFHGKDKHCVPADSMKKGLMQTKVCLEHSSF